MLIGDAIGNNSLIFKLWTNKVSQHHSA